jgi:lactate racemase
MGEYFLLSKQGKVFFQVPQAWSVLNNVVIAPTRPGQPVNGMLDQAVTQPIGTPPLAEMVKATDKVVIIVDDFTRPTPKRAILTGLIDRLHALGVDYGRIDILFGVGTHRPVTEAEAKEALGPLVEKLRWTNHDCWSQDLTPVGTCRICGDLKVNPLLPAADFRISVGSVLAHPMAGFGGGSKSIMPGVSDFESIRRHHMSTFLPRPYLGETKDNPCREGICSAARLARLDFIINAVYNAEHEVMAIVAGDPEKAHQAGVEMSLKEYGVEIDPKTDVTIISAFPYDVGNQIIKPLIPAAMATKGMGTVILVAFNIQGGHLPEEMLNAFDMVWAQVEGDPAKTALDCIRQNRLIVKGGPLDLNAASFLNLLILSQVRVILVSPDVTAEEAARIGFDYAPTIEQAIGTVKAKIPQATVNILPLGGMIVPVVKEKLSFAEQK